MTNDRRGYALLLSLAMLIVGALAIRYFLSSALNQTTMSGEQRVLQQAKLDLESEVQNTLRTLMGQLQNGVSRLVNGSTQSFTSLGANSPLALTKVAFDARNPLGSRFTLRSLECLGEGQSLSNIAGGRYLAECTRNSAVLPKNFSMVMQMYDAARSSFVVRSIIFQIAGGNFNDFGIVVSGATGTVRIGQAEFSGKTAIFFNDPAAATSEVEFLTDNVTFDDTLVSNLSFQKLFSNGVMPTMRGGHQVDVPNTIRSLASNVDGVTFDSTAPASPDLSGITGGALAMPPVNQLILGGPTAADACRLTIKTWHRAVSGGIVDFSGRVGGDLPAVPDRVFANAAALENRAIEIKGDTEVVAGNPSARGSGTICSNPIINVKDGTLLIRTSIVPGDQNSATPFFVADAALVDAETITQSNTPYKALSDTSFDTDTLKISGTFFIRPPPTSDPNVAVPPGALPTATYGIASSTVGSINASALLTSRTKLAMGIPTGRLVFDPGLVYPTPTGLDKKLGRFRVSGTVATYGPPESSVSQTNGTTTGLGLKFDYNPEIEANANSKLILQTADFGVAIISVSDTLVSEAEMRRSLGMP